MRRLIHAKALTKLYMILFAMLFLSYFTINEYIMKDDIFRSLVSEFCLSFGSLVIVQTIGYNLFGLRCKMKKVNVFNGLLSIIGVIFVIAIFSLKIDEWNTGIYGQADYYFVMLPIFVGVLPVSNFYIGKDGIIISNKELSYNEISDVIIQKSFLGMYVLIINTKPQETANIFITIDKKSSKRIYEYFKSHSEIMVRFE